MKIFASLGVQPAEVYERWSAVEICVVHREDIKRPDMEGEKWCGWSNRRGVVRQSAASTSVALYRSFDVVSFNELSATDLQWPKGAASRRSFSFTSHRKVDDQRVGVGAQTLEKTLKIHIRTVLFCVGHGMTKTSKFSKVRNRSQGKGAQMKNKVENARLFIQTLDNVPSHYCRKSAEKWSNCICGRAASAAARASTMPISSSWSRSIRGMHQFLFLFSEVFLD